MLNASREDAGSSFFLANDERSAARQKARYKISIPIPSYCKAKVTWEERFTPTGSGNVFTASNAKSAEKEWGGTIEAPCIDVTGGETVYYDVTEWIDLPDPTRGAPGTWTVANVHMECPLS